MKDNCVTCGEESVYDMKENILWRMAYIVGVGQLCFQCYDEIYIKSKNKKEMKNENEPMERLRKVHRNAYR